MRSEHYQEASLKVRVPRGQEGFWQIIRQLHETQGTFTVADIDGESNVPVKSIQKYVRLLVAGGFLECTGSVKRRSLTAPVYRLVKPQKPAPRVRADGSLIAADAIDHLWTAMRTLKTFGLRELIFAATTTDVKPTYQLAKRYVCYLTSAGYFMVLQPKQGSKPQVWRLKPAGNTGPKAPRLKAVGAFAVWDPNCNAFMGGSSVVSEVAP